MTATLFQPSGGFSSAIGSPTIQYGSVTLGVADVSNTAAITNVDTTRSHVVYLGSSTTQSAPGVGVRPQYDFCRLALTNGTTVTATRNSAAAGETSVVAFAVITWATGVTTNVQAGAITIPTSTASATATIAAVTVANTLLFWLGQECADNTLGRVEMGRIALTNTTTVTATRVGVDNLGTLIVGFVAVSFA